MLSALFVELCPLSEYDIEPSVKGDRSDRLDFPPAVRYAAVRLVSLSRFALCRNPTVGCCFVDGPMEDSRRESSQMMAASANQHLRRQLQDSSFEGEKDAPAAAMW